MKARLNVTVDRGVIHRARQMARTRGVSLSSLIESSLREMTEGESRGPFTASWRGTMVLAERDEPRYRALNEKYG